MAVHNRSKITSVVVDDKIRIEIPIKKLVKMFNLHPDNDNNISDMSITNERNFANTVAEEMLMPMDVIYDDFFAGNKTVKYSPIESAINLIFQEIFYGSVFWDDFAVNEGHDFDITELDPDYDEH